MDCLWQSSMVVYMRLVAYDGTSEYLFCFSNSSLLINSFVGALNIVERYDPTANQWYTVASMGTRRQHRVVLCTMDVSMWLVEMMEQFAAVVCRTIRSDDKCVDERCGSDEHSSNGGSLAFADKQSSPKSNYFSVWIGRCQWSTARNWW